MKNLLVQIKDATFSYNGEIVLHEVGMEIFEGDFIAMIGPNGGGKTTLLKLILGLLQPESGFISVLGQPAPRASLNIGYVPQDVHTNRNFPVTALDVVLMGLLAPRKRWRPYSAGERHQAKEALGRLGSADLSEKKIGSLSGGQRQRVFIARALVSNPSLLLLDEPTASIDSKGQTDFFEILRKLNEDTAVLVVSHDLQVVSRYAKSVACVNRRLHYHHQAEITGTMMDIMYPCTVEKVCPVELVAHGLPHRVLQEHPEYCHD